MSGIPGWAAWAKTGTRNAGNIDPMEEWSRRQQMLRLMGQTGALPFNVQPGPAPQPAAGPNLAAIGTAANIAERGMQPPPSLLGQSATAQQIQDQALKQAWADSQLARTRAANEAETARTLGYFDRNPGMRVAKASATDTSPTVDVGSQQYYGQLAGAKAANEMRAASASPTAPQPTGPTGYEQWHENTPAKIAARGSVYRAHPGIEGSAQMAEVMAPVAPAVHPGIAEAAHRAGLTPEQYISGAPSGPSPMFPAINQQESQDWARQKTLLSALGGQPNAPVAPEVQGVKIGGGTLFDYSTPAAPEVHAPNMDAELADYARQAALYQSMHTPEALKQQLTDAQAAASASAPNLPTSPESLARARTLLTAQPFAPTAEAKARSDAALAASAAQTREVNARAGLAETGAAGGTDAVRVAKLGRLRTAATNLMSEQIIRNPTTEIGAGQIMLEVNNALADAGSDPDLRAVIINAILLSPWYVIANVAQFKLKPAKDLIDYMNALMGKVGATTAVATGVPARPAIPVPTQIRWPGENPVHQYNP